MLKDTDYEIIIKALVEKVNTSEWQGTIKCKQIEDLRKENDSLKAENHRLAVENENLKLKSIEEKEIDE